MAKFAVILPAAGASTRFKDQHYKKPFALLADRAVWLHTVERFVNRDDVAQTILVIAPEDREMFQMKFGANVAIFGIQVVDGGAERSDSVQAALAQVRKDIDFIAVHDAARPCLVDAWVDDIFAAAEKSGAAIPAVPVVGTLKESTDGKAVAQTVNRQHLWEAQTPQVFRSDWLRDAYAARGDFSATDDAQLVERLGHPVTVVRGSRLNLKITTREDLKLAAGALRALPKPKLAGPAHPFADDDLWR